MLDNPLDIVKLLNGAELKVFLIMGIVRTRVNVAFLVRNSGYTDKPVSQALRYLEDRGLANRTSAGWQLTRPDAVQLPLAPAEIEAENPDIQANAGSEIPEFEEDNSDTDGGSRNNSDSLLVSLVNIDSINQEDLTKLTNNEKSRKNSDSDAIWDELGSFGVKKNRATEQIAALDWVNAAYIRGMAEKLEGEGRTWPKDCGLLLYRLRQKPKAQRHGKDCRCEACDAQRRARYAR